VAVTGAAMIPLVGGHLAIDLVNTVSPRLPFPGEDFLATPEDLLVWAGRTGILGQAEAASVAVAWRTSDAAAARALAAVKETRESLAAVLSTLVSGTPQEAVHIALQHLALGWATAAARSRLVLSGERGVAAHRVVASPAELLIPDRIADAAVQLLCDVDLSTLRMCPPELGGCGWLFIDRTRNGSRRWCTVDVCGNEARSRRQAERRRLRREAPQPVG